MYRQERVNERPLKKNKRTKNEGEKRVDHVYTLSFWGCCQGIGEKQNKRKYRKEQKFSPSDRCRGDRGHRIPLVEIISIAHSQSQKYAFQGERHEEEPCLNLSAARQKRSSNRHLAVEE